MKAKMSFHRIEQCTLRKLVIFGSAFASIPEPKRQ